MKSLLTTLLILVLFGCDGKEMEGYIFKKSLEAILVERCRVKDRLCTAAVKQQTDECAEKLIAVDFYRILRSLQKKRFQEIFFKCLVDAKGKPFFEV